MNRVLKTFLLWLLIAALPMQGVAAVLKSSCGSAHHGSIHAAMSMPAHDHDATDGHVHADGHAMHFSTDMSSPDASPAASPAAEDSSVTLAHASTYCSACAACCTGAVGPPAVPISAPASNGSETVVLSPMPSIAGFVPAGLERPPKKISI